MKAEELLSSLETFVTELRENPRSAIMLAVAVGLLVLLFALTPGGNDFSYGGGSRRLDLYAGEGCSREGCPVIVFAHGGGWVKGDRRDDEVVRIAKMAQKHGVTFVSINYRSLSDTPFPAPVEDVAQAAAWVKTNIGSYGGNPARIYLMGASAGAHLVALAGIDDTYLGKYGMKPARDLAGIIGVNSISYDIASRRASGRAQDEIIDEIFPPAVRTQASPFLQVQSWRSYPPFLLMTVTNDSEALEQASRLSGRLLANGNKAEVMTRTYQPTDRKFHLMILDDLADERSELAQRLFKFVGVR